MALPIDQLTAPLTEEDVKQSLYNLMVAAGLPVTSWIAGSVIRTMIAVVAKTYATFTTILANLTKAEFLDLAESFWLTLLAKFVYNVDRIPSGFATGTETLINSGGAIYSFDPGDVIFKNSVTNKTYFNVDAFTLNPAEEKDIDIQAFEAGPDSTAAIGQINSLVTELLGVSVSNPGVLVGTSEEKDPDLRIRCRNALGALSPNGPLDAYNFFAKSTARPDGTIITVNRVKVSADSSTGVVQVYLADPDGPLDSADVTLIDENIQQKCVPIAVTAIIDNAVAVVVNLTIQAWFTKTINNTVQSITDAINTSLTNTFAVYPIGGLSLTEGGQGYLWADKVKGAVEGADPSIYKVDLSITSLNPVIPQIFDVELAPNEVVIYSLPLGSLTVTPVNN